ncbi:hypothetical protein JF729_18475 [Mycobacterium intracellulare]|uniref:hypothetical protein n=1 Tax=Mycobacterium intracellulare TaxID=1767 RepID=UPI001CD96D29|nr:hypothetical protein [Mycobacterium intracellulare]MCA2249766.1 hypothetical protein [Mycobacterium intracellulare]
MVQDLGLARLADIRRQLAQARRELATAAVEYASTPDGAAETYRRYELAAPGPDRDVLRATYLSGLEMASHEYEERRSRGSASVRDGYLHTVPVGDFADPITQLLVRHRVMGTYRSGPWAVTGGVVEIHLLRLLPDGATRWRARVAAPAELGCVDTSLADILTQAWQQTDGSARLEKFLGPDLIAGLTAELHRREQAAMAP